ncbi:heavy-metal-associated domain-containing protein [Clostridium sp. Marseille-P2415]|uniref:heavy-metal-associated domain-containing protein n=1 Tax=Clostridium sp. Marseille-P2415 TaxID=1805471 RepID=UPI00098834D4|nr:heavy metal-associated domain-containing protein [Clostridium sp. Marseille-P2415]
MSTAIICMILVIICYFGLKSTIKRTKHGCCGSGGDEVKKIKAADKNISHYPFTSTLQVEGMTCGNCKKRVENAFNSQEGLYASVDLNKKLAVIHMKEQVPEDKLKEIVRKAGYMPGNIKEMP